MTSLKEKIEELEKENEELREKLSEYEDGDYKMPKITPENEWFFKSFYSADFATYFNNAKIGGGNNNDKGE